MKQWILMAVSLLLSASLHAGETQVAVAANFTDASREIAALFEKSSGHRLKVSYGSTGKLYTQIENGAPFELFLAADSAHPAKAEANGLAVAGSRFVYARGRLVLWSASPALFNDGESYLKAMSYRHLAIANPRTAPYGAAARQLLQRLGIWDQLTARLVNGDSIAQTFQFVASGNAEAGLVAYSQVKAWEGAPGTLWQIPVSDYDPIEQEAVLLKKGAANPAALAFFDFLKSAEAQAVIRTYGYGM